MDLPSALFEAEKDWTTGTRIGKGAFASVVGVTLRSRAAMNSKNCHNYAAFDRANRDYRPCSSGVPLGAPPRHPAVLFLEEGRAQNTQPLIHRFVAESRTS
jgi:hypothetical protein